VQKKHLPKLISFLGKRSQKSSNRRGNFFNLIKSIKKSAGKIVLNCPLLLSLGKRQENLLSRSYLALGQKFQPMQ
jgi:hypothetical protein